MLSLLRQLEIVPADYRVASLGNDVTAGITTAVMLIPQAIAYAILAGLPPIVGLYAAVVPLVAYALVGSSRELALGPAALDSLLVASTVGVLAKSGSDRYLELAMLLALMVGAIQMVLGALRGGFLVNFLSRPVISGFTSAAALIIAASQLPTLLGLDLPRATSVFSAVVAVTAHLSGVDPASVTVSMISMVVLGALKHWAPRIPRALVVVALGALLAFPGFIGLPVAVLGDVPSGLPSFDVPAFRISDLRPLLPGAMTIALVGFMEAISISSKLGVETGHRVNPNREFLALGMANVCAGLFRGFPVAGGLSRTAVNADAGAQSKLAGLVTAAGVVLTLAFLTDFLYYIPTASLAAIIVMAVGGLFDAREPFRLWAVKRNDFWMLVATFGATLVVGIQQGILTGVGLSVMAIVVRTTRPHTAVLGRLPGTEVYRNVLRFPEAQTTDGVLIVRLDAQFYFGNVNFLRDTLAELETEMESKKAPPLRTLILDGSGINQIDSSGEATLREMMREYRDRDIRLILAAVKGPVRDVLQRSGFTEELGEDGFAFRIHDAIESLNQTAKG